MQKEQALRIIETLLFMTDHPLSEVEIVEVLDSKMISAEDVKSMILEIGQKYEAQNSPVHVVEVAGGFQMATQPDMAPFIRKLYKERLMVRLSPSALETLAIIAYKQPISKGDVEQIRGVEASGVMDTLLERRLIKVVGRKETIGRPLLYGTTQDFLRQFGLKHLTELPDLSSLPISTPAPTEETVMAEQNPIIMDNESNLVAVGVEVESATQTVNAEESAIISAEGIPTETVLSETIEPASIQPMEDSVAVTESETILEEPTPKTEEPN